MWTLVCSKIPLPSVSSTGVLVRVLSVGFTSVDYFGDEYSASRVYFRLGAPDRGVNYQIREFNPCEAQPFKSLASGPGTPRRRLTPAQRLLTIELFGVD